MALQQLSRRLNKLEESRGARSLCPNYFAPFALAKEKLSAVDRNAIETVRLTPVETRSEEQRAMWERFERAFEEAVEETKIPHRMYLSDMYL